MPSQSRYRRCWPPRFSLRALLIVITLLCLVFAPVLPELNRADRIARQVKLIEEMGGRCVFVNRPQSVYADLVQRLWPVQIAHIEHELLMAEFNAQTVDLAKLRQATEVRGVCFNECRFVTPDDEPHLELPRIEYVQLQERDDTKGGKPDPAILRRFPGFFPNLRKSQLMGVPQEQEFIAKLASCERLEDLDVWFRPPCPDIETTPLGKLSSLRRLRVSEVSGSWDWRFLARLENLEEIELGSEQRPVLSDDDSRTHQPPERMVSPAKALIGHKRLRHLTLYESSDWIEHLRTIAKNNDLEAVHVDGHGFTNSMLEALAGETHLRSLGTVPIRDDSERDFERLRRLGELRELEIRFVRLTDDDLRRLSELKSLERIALSIDPTNGAVSSEGVELARKLPGLELSLRSTTLPRAEGMQELIRMYLMDHMHMPASRPSSQTDDGVRFLRAPR
jgi:hypothetical protein